MFAGACSRLIPHQLVCPSHILHVLLIPVHLPPLIRQLSSVRLPPLIVVHLPPTCFRPQNKNTGKPFGIDVRAFGKQSETIEATVPELNVARAHVLDYFQELNIPDRNQVFSWEKQNYTMNPGRPSIQFVKMVGSALCCPGNVYSITGTSANMAGR